MFAPSVTVVELEIMTFESVIADVVTVCAVEPANSTVLPALNVGFAEKLPLPPLSTEAFT